MAVETVDPDRIGTPALGIKIFKQTQNEGNASVVAVQSGLIDVETAADLLNEAARRAAVQAVKLGGRNGDGKSDWKWLLGMALAILAIVWAGAFMFADRPTETKVKDMVATTRQHPDSKAMLQKHEQELMVQKLQLVTIVTEFKAMNETLVEIKNALKEDRKYK